MNSEDHPSQVDSALAAQEVRVADLEHELAEARACLADLREQEATSRGPGPAPQALSSGPLARRSVAEKIALFRSLFRGREDVYPRFWHNAKRGQSGYSPAYAHEGVQGFGQKPRSKLGDSANRAFLPVTDRVIEDHLRGRHIIGVYPLLSDDAAVRERVLHLLIVRDTPFAADLAEPSIHEVCAALGASEARNDLLFDDILRALEAGRSPLVLTERRDHLEYLAGRLRPFTRHLVVMHGGTGTKVRWEVARQLAEIPPDEERLVLATGRYVGEGFDDARFDTLFIAMPFAWKGTLVQYAGRLQREYSGKRDVRVYDYVDRAVPVLVRMFEKRLRGYRALGYQADP